MSDCPRVLDELGAELGRAARRTLSAGAETAAGRPRRRWWRLRAAPVVLLLVLGGAAAALAGGLISIGAPAAPTPVLSNADRGLGTVTPGSVRLLQVAVADPQGGSPWGLRVLTTTRGAGCVQIGRLVDDKLVALGQDGAFDNDGQAHPLPLSTAVNSFNCTPLDAKGRQFDSVTMVGQSASAAWWFRSTGCVPSGTPQTTSRVHPACSQHDERDVYFGLLGPDAESITYKLAGQIHTQPAVGPEGAYLIVTASDHQRIPGSGGGIADDVPAYSPIVSINYRNGATCHLLTWHSWIPGARACSPPLPEPVGYAPVSVPTHAEIASPVHAALGRSPIGGRAIVVTFKSRIAITNVRGYYELQWRTPAMLPKAYGFSQMSPEQTRLGRGFSRAGITLGLEGSGVDIAAGQTVTGMILSPIGLRAPAAIRLSAGTTIHGTAILRYSTGPSLDGEQPTAEIPVGSFAFTMP